MVGFHVLGNDSESFDDFIFASRMSRQSGLSHRDAITILNGRKFDKIVMLDPDASQTVMRPLLFPTCPVDFDNGEICYRIPHA